MIRKSFVMLSLIISFLLISTIGGVYATWRYAYTQDVEDKYSLFGIGLNEFTYKPFEGVYIYSAEIYDSRNITSNALEFTHPTDLYSSVKASSSASITYKVTFHNKSSVNQWFIQQTCDEKLVNNSLIGARNGITIITKDHPGDSTSTFNENDWIPADTFRVVYITYNFGSNAVNNIITFVTYMFGVKMDSVYTNFADVLNTTESYALLTQAFNDKYQKTGEVTIANIGEEKQIFDQIFGENITIDVNGEEKPVTIMIRRENVDNKSTGDSYSGSGPSGCEYTLYITIDELDPDKNPTGKATVYAISYSEGGISNQSQWYQLGELYEGTAQLDDYGTGDAFDYRNWTASPKEYVVANGVTYLVGQEQGDQYDKLKKLEDIMSTQDQDIFNFIDGSNLLKNVYAIVHNNKNEGKPGYDILREAFLDARPFYVVHNGGAEVKVNRNCTRAELVPYIEAIQKALDYYNQVN